jgi:hypothetical protein
VGHRDLCPTYWLSVDGRVLDFDLIEQGCILSYGDMGKFVHQIYEDLSKGASCGDQSTRCDFS